MSKKSEKVDAAPEKTAVDVGPNLTDSFYIDAADGEREEILNEYNETNNIIEDQETDASADTEDDTQNADEETVLEEPDSPAETGETEVDVSENETGEGINDEKTVPLAALHEEREKRKGLSKEVSELKERLKEILLDNKEMRDSMEKQRGPVDEYDDPQSSEIRLLKEQLAELVRFKNEFVQKTMSDEQRVAAERREKTLDEIDKELTSQGYPGFRFAEAKIRAELQAMVEEDPDNKYLDTKEGVANIYKERVFPKLRGLFSKAAKDETDAEKIARKKNANLAGGPGKPPPKGKKDSEKTTEELYAEYLERRTKAQIS